MVFTASSSQTESQKSPFSCGRQLPLTQIRLIEKKKEILNKSLQVNFQNHKI